MSRPICRRCERPVSECYCAALVSVDNALPVLILQHPSERDHPYNTARIAKLCLRRCHLAVGEEISSEIAGEIRSSRSLLVFPELPWLAPAEELREEPELLILLDGTWNKAKKILHANPWLQRVPRMALHPRAPSAYGIRKSPFPHGLSTVESAVAALDRWNGDRDHAALLQPFEEMIRLARRYQPTNHA